MRRLLLFFSFLPLVLNGQVEYQPYASQSAAWYYNEECGFGFPEQHYEQWVMLGATLVNGVSYHKLNGVPRFREDVANQKLYCLDDNLVEWDISVDQFLTAGDTFRCASAYQYLYPFGEFIPFDYGIVVYTDVHHDRTSYQIGLYDAADNPIGSLQYIAGIGFTETSAGECWTETLCYSEDFEMVIGGEFNPYVEFCEMAELQSEEIPAFSLFPNPAMDQVELVVKSGGAYQYEIADLTGRVHLSGTFTETSSTIPVSSLEAGVFLITITNTHGNGKVSTSRRFQKL